MNKFYSMLFIFLFLCIGFLSWKTGQELSEIEQDMLLLQREIDRLEQQLRRNTDFLEQFEVKEMTVSAYAPFDNQSGICSDGNPAWTASGAKTVIGTSTAVNPNFIPYGTKIFVPGYGWGVAHDTGSRKHFGDSEIDKNLLDVTVTTYKEAIKWGRQQVKVVLFNER